MPWKNGAGTARQVALHPADAAMNEWDWFVAIAEVTVSSPFSAYPGVDRQIALLRGAGIRLRSIDGRFDHNLDTPLQIFSFPGEARINSELTGSSCEAINVMARRGCVKATTLVINQGCAPARNGATLIFCARHLIHVVHGISGCTDLPVGQAVLWRGSTPQLELKPSKPAARAVMIQFSDLRVSQFAEPK